MELERQENVLVVCDQAVARSLLAYFNNNDPGIVYITDTRLLNCMIYWHVTGCRSFAIFFFLLHNNILVKTFIILLFCLVFFNDHKLPFSIC